MSWNGVKKQSLEQEIKSWCDEMGIRNYTINSKGEIDVNRDVNLRNKNLKELPYKFGRVNGFFTFEGNKNLISLKNCPIYTGGSFSCNECPKINSLEGCPKYVSGDFYCYFNVLTSLTLPENSGVGKIGKPKSRKRGWGEAEFLYLYYSTIISNGGQRGWGSWGHLLCLVHLACRSSAPPSSCYPSPDKPTAFFKRYWLTSSGDIMLSAKWSLAAE